MIRLFEWIYRHAMLRWQPDNFYRGSLRAMQRRWIDDAARKALEDAPRSDPEARDNLVDERKRLRLEMTALLKTDPRSIRVDDLFARISQINCELADGGLETRITLGRVPVYDATRLWK